MLHLWTTSHELKFIDNLGSHRIPNMFIPSPLNKLTILLGYEEGISRRVVWDGIHRDTVLKHVENRKAELTKQCHANTYKEVR